MTTFTLPEVAVEAQLLTDIESVLFEGETVAMFVEAAVRRAIEHRRKAHSTPGDSPLHSSPGESD
jgi:hypothetical protein